MQKFEILNVRPAPQGFDDSVIALVTFTYRPDPMDGPVVVSRYSKAADREFPIATIGFSEGAQVKVHDASLRSGRNGPWLQAGGVNVPRELAAAIAERADEISRTQSEYHGGGRPTDVAAANARPSVFNPAR